MSITKRTQLAVTANKDGSGHLYTVFSYEIRMNHGRLSVVPVPWLVSPSVPGLKIEVTENADARAIFDVLVLADETDAAQLVRRGVELRFEHGQWLRTHPAADDTEPIADGYFDREGIEQAVITGDGSDWERDFKHKWRSRGMCPDPGFYEVANSAWLVDENAVRFGCRHFVLVGHDLWVEVLCMGIAWQWTTPQAIGIETAGLAATDLR
jgi:hypothetical protein